MTAVDVAADATEDVAVVDAVAIMVAAAADANFPLLPKETPSIEGFFLQKTSLA